MGISIADEKFSDCYPGICFADLPARIYHIPNSPVSILREMCAEDDFIQTGEVYTHYINWQKAKWVVVTSLGVHGKITSSQVYDLLSVDACTREMVLAHLPVALKPLLKHYKRTGARLNIPKCHQQISQLATAALNLEHR